MGVFDRTADTLLAGNLAVGECFAWQGCLYVVVDMAAAAVVCQQAGKPDVRVVVKTASVRRVTQEAFNRADNPGA